VRQMRVGAAYPGVGIPDNIRVKVHHLHERMHARVCAPGAQGGHTSLGKLLERPFQPVLHRQARRLALPPLVCLSAVAHTQCNAHPVPRFQQHTQSFTGRGPARLWRAAAVRRCHRRLLLQARRGRPLFRQSR